MFRPGELNQSQHFPDCFDFVFANPLRKRESQHGPRALLSFHLGAKMPVRAEAYEKILVGFLKECIQRQPKQPECIQDIFCHGSAI